MNNDDFIKINKGGWNRLVKSGKPYSNTSLPEYGPFMENENKLELFKDVKEKKVLELGCSEGKSLEFLKQKGAKGLWGIDISEEQINILRQKDGFDSEKFFISPMEKNPGLPTDYFDYVLSLYSIGFSSDIEKTIELVNQYLRKDGIFIVSWIHPFFNCLSIEDDRLVVDKSYNDESSNIITKGPDKIEMAQYNLKISTLVNIIINSGLSIDRIIEETPIEENNIGDYDSRYWDKRKTCACPTTLIIIAHKN